MAASTTITNETINKSILTIFETYYFNSMGLPDTSVEFDLTSLFLPCLAKSIFDSILWLEFNELNSRKREFFSEESIWSFKFCYVSK